MKLIKQVLFSIEFTRAGWGETSVYVEAENMEKALSMAGEINKHDNYKEWKLCNIRNIGECYKESTKTITVEV